MKLKDTLHSTSAVEKQNWHKKRLLQEQWGVSPAEEIQKGYENWKKK